MKDGRRIAPAAWPGRSSTSKTNGSARAPTSATSGDDVLPAGRRGDDAREARCAGGTVTFATLAVIAAVDNLESAAMGTLSPDIRDSLRISNGAVFFSVSASSAFLIVGALPMGWLADRYRRGRTIGSSNLFFGDDGGVRPRDERRHAVLARLGVGSTRSNKFTVQGTLMADNYPITSRGRVAARLSIFGSVTGTISPLLVGGLATWIGGPRAWRWVFVILAIPIALVSLFGFAAARAAAWSVREAGRPRRGRSRRRIRCRSRWRRRSPG